MRIPQEPFPVKYKKMELRVHVEPMYARLKAILSPRELDVLHRMLLGQPLEMVARELCLAPKTVSTYKYRIFEKLDSGNPYELAAYACREGILTLEEVTT